MIQGGLCMYITDHGVETGNSAAQLHYTSRGNTMKLILLKSHLISFFLYLFLFALPAAAQNPVNGNGNIIEEMRPLKTFSSVSLDFPADLTIVNGETPSFKIEADQNILPHIGTQVRGGKLYITQDKWIQPSKSVTIRVGTPFTSALETSGYSDVVIEGIDGPRLQVNAGVGKVKLHGKAERLLVRTKTGNIDAMDLSTSYADVSVTSHGTIKLGKVDQLITKISDTGTVIYNGTPSKIDSDNDKAMIVSADEYVDPSTIQVEYVSFTLVNNSRKKLSLRVEGPREKQFGYGFNLLSNASRKENWPVGTKLYQEGRLLSDKLLLTINKDMIGKEVDIFGNE